MATTKVPFSKVPFSDLKDRPDDKWSQAVIGGLNQSMLALSGSSQSIEYKTVDVVVPDPWIVATFQGDWAGKGGDIKYMRHYDGSIQIRGFCLSGTYAAVAFILPQYARPASDLYIPYVSVGAFGYLYIQQSNGYCYPMVGGAGSCYIHTRFIPANNRPQPLKCFPINVKTKFKKAPRSVVCLKNERVGQNSVLPVCVAMLPAWRFINGPDGPTVQITDIPGLEYGCRQRVSIAIIGG